MASVYAFIVSVFIYRDMGPLKTAEGKNPLSLRKNPHALLPHGFMRIHAKLSTMLAACLSHYCSLLPMP